MLVNVSNIFQIQIYLRPTYYKYFMADCFLSYTRKSVKAKEIIKIELEKIYGDS